MNNTKHLHKINSSDDVKKLLFNELDELSEEIRDYIHEVISNLGGHYSSPLGVIDLTLALNYVYSLPYDKIVWDVGHQAYAHKIITGRRNEFKKIRQKDGISGFLKPSESECDAFGAGHASTSISAALGLAHVRDKRKTDENILAIIGDGAMTGGLAYEALNNLGYHRTQLTVILNDNSLSISKSVGALSKYLTRITTNPTYNRLRKDIWNISGKIPTISKYIQSFLKKTEGSMKAYLTPGSFFEELGLRYIGPIDGHNINEMVNVLNSVKTMKTPVLLHVYTDKTKKIKQNSLDAIKYYSLSGNNKNSTKSNNKSSFSNVLGNSLYRLANDNEFTCVTAAMEIGTGLTEYTSKYPNRYIDVGIAEGHAVTYSAGLSIAGELPIIPIYSTFMQRAYDHIIHDFALQSLPGIFCMDRAGLVGNDGPTHHGVFDISFMCAIPKMLVFAPRDGNELYDILFTSIKQKLFISIRYPKALTEYDKKNQGKLIKIGTWTTITEGINICILAVGSMVEICEESVKKLHELSQLNVTLINCRFIKPIDEELLIKLIKSHETFITVEEGLLSGGFGSQVSKYFYKNDVAKKLITLGIDDKFSDHGTRDELLNELSLDSNSIYKIVKDLL